MRKSSGVVLRRRGSVGMAVADRWIAGEIGGTWIAEES